MANLHDQLIDLTERRIQLIEDEHLLVGEALEAGWTYTDIAATLGISRQAVAQRYATSGSRRARARASAVVQARHLRERAAQEFEDLITEVLGPRDEWPARWEERKRRGREESAAAARLTANQPTETAIPDSDVSAA